MTFLVKLLAAIYRFFTGREIDSFHPDDFEENENSENKKKGQTE